MSLSRSSIDVAQEAPDSERTSATGVVASDPSSAGSAALEERPARHGIWALPLYVVVQVALLAGLRAVVPRFFWADDTQIQFTPMHWWIGRQLGEGSLPLLDPDQGMAGNLTADMQNGVLDPTRWPFLLWAGEQQDLLLVATAQGWLSVLVLGCASLTLLLNHGVRPALAVAGAVGVATSGFFLWWGSAWSPSMWSLAALIWLWSALSSRRWYGVVGVAFASAAVVCSGNPYLLPLVVVLLSAQAYERWRDSGRMLFRDRHFWATVVALVAGAAFSLATVVNALDVAQWMWRPDAGDVLAATGTATNVLDILLGGTTMMYFLNVPIFGTAVIALPLLALVDWRTAVRSPGVVTAGALCVVSVLWTQLPFYFLSFRGPFRLLGGVQVSYGLLALLAFTAAMRLTRRRLIFAFGLLMLQFVVVVMRAPVFWRWHVLSLALAALAFAAVVLFVRSYELRRRPWSRRWLRPAAAVASVLLCAAPLAVQLGMQISIQERHEALSGSPGQPEATIYRPYTNGYRLGTTVAQFRDNAFTTDASLTVYPFGAFADPDDRGWQRGVLGGNLNLLAGLRPGYGSLAVWPKGVQEHVTADWQGSLVSEQPGLLVVPEGSDVPWIDLLSSNRVLLGVEGSVPAPIAEHFAQNWDRVSSGDGWTEYARPEPLPGRVSMRPADGVSVSDAAPNDGVATLGEPFERYTVSTGDDGGRLVFRTPYWNGFTATVDGRPVEVSAFADAVLQVDLPGGLSDAALEISFEPLGARLLPVSVASGAVLVVVSALVAVWARRSRSVSAEDDRHGRAKESAMMPS